MTEFRARMLTRASHRGVLALGGAIFGMVGGIVGFSGCGKSINAQPVQNPPTPAAASAPAAPAPAAPAAAAVTPKTQTPEAARSLSNAFAAAAKAIQPSVVRIDVEKEPPRLARMQQPGGGRLQGIPPIFERFFHEFDGDRSDGPGLPMPEPQRGTGSGFFLDTKGTIVTNSHVVEGASKLKVTLQTGEEVSAQVVGRDSRTDVAVVKLEKVPQGLVAARIGDSDKVEVAEWVLAVGSPLGLETTVTAGIVSGKGKVGRHIQMSGDRVREYIQTDAKINPGNSGGPLVNLDGEVVGINTLIRVGAGGAYGFAVPINEARRVADKLVTDGRIKYPYLGVSLRDLGDVPAEARAQFAREIGVKILPEKGAIVAEVPPGSPAEKAGLKAGDVITNIDDRKVDWASDVVDQVSRQAIGATVNVKVVREGGEKVFAVKLAEAPSADANPVEGGRLGLSLQSLTPKLAESLGVPPNTRGVVIADVTEGSPAARAELVPGDLILEIDRKPIASAEEAATALKAGGSHVLRVRGREGTRFVTLP